VWSECRVLSGKNITIIDCARYIKKTVLCLGNNDVNHIREGSLEGRSKISVDPIVYRQPARKQFPVYY
jgi:hypothetical protein